MHPLDLVTLLNELYSRFETNLDRRGVFKIDTIGDAFVVVGGLVLEDSDINHDGVHGGNNNNNNINNNNGGDDDDDDDDRMLSEAAAYAPPQFAPHLNRASLSRKSNDNEDGGVVGGGVVDGSGDVVIEVGDTRPRVMSTRARASMISKPSSSSSSSSSSTTFRDRSASSAYDNARETTVYANSGCADWEAMAAALEDDNDNDDDDGSGSGCGSGGGNSGSSKDAFDSSGGNGDLERVIDAEANPRSTRNANMSIQLQDLSAVKPPVAPATATAGTTLRAASATRTATRPAHSTQSTSSMFSTSSSRT
jgi:hypothetical protein